MSDYKVKKRNDDQKPRGMKIQELQEKAERLRRAECAARGGEYMDGQCYISRGG